LFGIITTFDTNMIAVLDLWNRVNQYAAKYQSGQAVVATFNAALAEVQAEVYNDLSPYYQVNEKVRGLLNVWVKVLNATFSAGAYTMPNGNNDPEFDRVISLAITNGSNPATILYEVNPITEGELVYANRIPQRAPDATKKRVYYLMDGPLTINVRPQTVNLPFVLYYLVYPTKSEIAFTYTETDDEDVMTYDEDNSTNLGWSKDAFNIILYKMLEKYGIETRDQWTAEYARMGLAKPILNQGGNS
jgi:hypothetical protein